MIWMSVAYYQMKSVTLLYAMLRLELTGALFTNDNICDALNIQPLAQLDLAKYVEKTWYIQKQQVTPYQKESQLFCVTATYEEREGSDFINVLNYGNNDGVNGRPQNSDNEGWFSGLCAKQDFGGSLSVAPCIFSPFWNWVAGPYWILAVADDYSWAIVSGGPPTEPKSDGTCTTKEGSSFLDINGSGLWLFTRDQIPAEGVVDGMLQMLDDMKIYTGDLKDVMQEGCIYEGATLK